MRVLLVSLNAKYIHTNLAIRYLEAFCKDINNLDIKIREFTINDQLQGILREIYMEKADIIALSCYIWNIEETIKLVQLIKSIQPGIKIILGGPEVTFYGSDWMEKIKEIDYIVKGEGEETFYELLEVLNATSDINNVEGIIYRNKYGKIKENHDRKLIENLDDIPFPYTGDLSSYKNKIIYYESSRGCPFKCQYCLSSTTSGVRFISMENAKKQLSFFIEAGVKQVKFVDRTFNCDKKRTKELLKYLIDQGGKTNFHFEVAADLIDQEILNILKSAPIGLFQLEIGVQSTHLPTLKEIQRVNDFEKIKMVVSRIKSFNNIHQHLDLIAGLPYENYEIFKKSFNDVYNIKPDMLQLGFLKVLKGSGIEVNKEKHGYKYTSFPPYEVLSNNYMSYGYIIKLKLVEEILEKYSNSHIFDYTIEYLLQLSYDEPFDFFENFSRFWEESDLFNKSHSQKNLYKIFMDYLKVSHNKNIKILFDLLKLDYLLSHKAPLPDFFINKTIKNNKEKSFEFLKQSDNVAKYLPEFKGQSAKEIYKHVYFEEFNKDILDIIGIKNQEDNKDTCTLLFYFPKQQNEIFNKALFHRVTL
jgi:radical SAM superfamily enzyme YgiQ (UPF0313 family)